MVMIRLEFEIFHEVGGEARELFLQALPSRFPDLELLGLEEGFVAAKGHVLDAAEAPADRDWINEQPWAKVRSYHAHPSGAEKLRQYLLALNNIRNVSAPEHVLDQDWNQSWKAWFKDLEAGWQVSPSFRVYPAWRKALGQTKEVQTLWIEPGAGFGTGTHETTQLCLEGLESLGLPSKGQGCLDIGTGSGILSIVAVKLGWRGFALEVDEAACENARLHFKLNDVSVSLGRVVQDVLAEGEKVDLVMANILTPSLVELKPLIKKVLRPGGALMLSGFFEKDAPILMRLYGPKALLLQKGEWCMLQWKEWDYE
jgi:ribosomal protein L11 methyltransferase